MSFHYASDGAAYGFGWMSIDELIRALGKYLKSYVICETYTELQSARSVPFRVLFLRNHYIAIISCSDGLLYFDSLGADHLQRLIGFEPPHCNYLAYQAAEATTCGAYVSFVGALYSTFKRGCTVNTLLNKIDYYLCPDPVINEFNMNIFLASQAIGEEFMNDERYVRTTRFVNLCNSLSNIDIE